MSLFSARTLTYSHRLFRSQQEARPLSPIRKSRPVAFAFVLGISLLNSSARAQTGDDVRPPATPLVTHSPYFCVWSMRDKLTDDWTRHWTGAVNALCGQIRIDGKPYRWAGPQPDSVSAMNQTRLDVEPTHTYYTFEQDGVRLDVTFFSPLLTNNLDVLARPVTYLTWDVRATDKKRHKIALYMDTTGEWAVNQPEQQINWDGHTTKRLFVWTCGTQDQPVLAKKGDNLRIDWGHFLVAVPKKGPLVGSVESDISARTHFAEKGYDKQTRVGDVLTFPRAANDRWPVQRNVFDFGTVGSGAASRHVLLGYDEDYAIMLLGQKLRPYWRRSGMEPDALLEAAERDYKKLDAQGRKFDTEFMADARSAGGDRYARLLALAYRQTLAANGLAADAQGNPLQFPKENFSNGCISTVDILYPTAPFFLLFSPRLLKAQLTPVMDYAVSGRWKFPFAPHDLGTYPLANGQVYGGGERTEENQMPVEESGNMLIMLAALAKIEGNADYANKYWPQMEKWAAYLRDKGLDPENQLCTDDFAGHLAHNTNLSLKAIVALGSYAMLADMTGHKAEADTYRKTAQDFAARWVSMADDGDHFRLTFDRADTWSQKYNLVWDKLLGLNLFPSTVAAKEIAYYKAHQNRYGLPLDVRKTYTKLDWTVWTATLADNDADFQNLVAPLYDFANDSPSRVPLTDWFETTNARQVGFQARSVVGGLFIKMLADPARWRKWAKD